MMRTPDEIMVLLRKSARNAAGALLGLTITIGMVVCGCASAQADEGDVARTLRAGSEVDYPPFCIVNEEGRADGFSVELLRAALAKMDREVTFRTGPWAEVRGWLERGKIDCLPLVGRTPEREELFDFTVPYLTMHGAIVVRDETGDIHSLTDLRGRRVGVMKGDNAEEFLRRKDRGLEIVTTPTFSEAFQALAEGRCDAVVVQRLVALRLLEQTELPNLRIIERPIPDLSQSWCFAVEEGDRDTLALLNEGLALCMADGTHRRLYSKWFAHLQLPTDRPVVIGGDHNYPPFEYLDKKGRPAGYNVDLIRAVADEVGLDIRIRLGNWPEIMTALKRGEIDAVQGMFYSPERDEKFDFSPAHSITHCVGVVRSDGEKPPSAVEDLRSRQIVVQEGDIMHDFCIEHGLTEHLTTVDTQEEALREVTAGRQDCALVARMTAFYWIEREGWDNLTVGGKPLASPDYCFAVPNENRALLAQLSEGLEGISHTDTYQSIREKWMGVYEEQFHWSDVLKILAMIAGPLLLIALLALLWSWGLRRQVASRTQELRESLEYQRAIIACSPVALYSIDMDGTVLTWNEAAERVFGWSAEEVIGKPLPIVPEAQQDEFTAMRQQVTNGDSFIGRELIRKRKDGSDIPISLSVAPILNSDGSIVGIMAAAEDVTARKRREARIDHLNQVLRAIRDVNQLITHENDRDALLQRSCEILISTRGYRSAWVALRDEDGTAQTVAESGFGDFPDFAPLREAMERGDWPACCRQAWESPNGIVPIHNTDHNCKTCPLSHTYRDTAALAGVLRHDDRDYGVLVVALPAGAAEDSEEQALFGELIGDVGYALHAMELARERQDATEALRRSEERFRRAIAEAPFPAMIHAEDGEVVLINAEWTRITGYPHDEIPTIQAWAEKAYGERQETVHKGIEALHEAAEHTDEGDFNIRCRDGSNRVWAFRSTPMGTDETGRSLVLSMAVDITEREKLQAQLTQAQKMESVGRLAGGVAHDFNNLIMGIMNYVELCREEIAENHAIRTWLDEIAADANRSANLTRQLLAFARKQTIAPKVVDINDAVGGMLKMLRRLIGEDIDLVWQPGTELGSVKIDPGQLDQILANLCVNARDAIGGTGKVTIETENASIDEEYCENHTYFQPGDFVVLAVSDDGCGMDRETRDNIFEPFFTTKPTGEGTGLGLATVYGIVKQNNGFINVYSEPGEGTTFRIYLPRAVEETAKKKHEKPTESRPGGTETILLVEDEKSIRVTTGVFLEKLGYTVLAAESPEKALAAAADHPGEVDLLITDVVMPGMNGRELSEKLAPDHPDMKIIYMSGYTANVIAHRGVLGDDVAFLSKPFTRDILAAKVREVLDEK